MTSTTLLSPKKATGVFDTTTPTVATVVPTHDQIAKKAYEIWEKQGRPTGRSLQNWIAAEAELRNAAKTLK